MSVAEAHAPLPAVHVRRTINATPAEVFAAWTDPITLAQWFGSPEVEVTEAVLDARVGGAYRIVMRGLESGRRNTLFGTYTEVRHPERLAFTWRIERTDETASPESLVTVDLVPLDGARTEIRLTHAQLSTEDARRGVKRGWNASFDKLDRLLTHRPTTEGTD